MFKIYSVNVVIFDVVLVKRGGLVMMTMMMICHSLMSLDVLALFSPQHDENSTYFSARVSAWHRVGLGLVESIKNPEHSKSTFP